MDSIFVLGDEDRSAFLRHMIQAFGCTYNCLWTYLPPSNCLVCLDGVYIEESSQQPSSSSGSLSRRLFDAYCKSVNYVDIGGVPGLALKNNVPYIEMKLPDIQRLPSSQVQLQFYQEAGIKTIVLMGCSSGEIELGFSTEPQVNAETLMRNWFPRDFSTQTSSPELPQPTSQNTSSSSALLVNTIEYSPSLFDIPNPSFFTEPPINPHQQEVNQIRTIESHEVDDAMTKAILAVLSSSSTTSSYSHHETNPRQNMAPEFRSYHSALSPVATTTQKNNMFRRRAFSYLTNLNTMRRQDVQENQPSSSQRQHVISERRRREKLNEGFEILRSLLPSAKKKDKASLLGSTTEYINVLQSEMDELIRRNQILERQLSTAIQREAGQEIGLSSLSEIRVNVEIARVSPSTSEARFLDLRVALRSGESSTSDLVIRVLEFLKQQRNVSLLSMRSSTRIVDSTTVHGLVLRLKVQGDEFDESGFQEAVRRIVEGLP